VPFGPPENQHKKCNKQQGIEDGNKNHGRQDLVMQDFNNSKPKKRLSENYFCNLIKVTGFFCHFLGKLNLITTNYFSLVT
jgi:hypothetical protein